MKRYTMTWRNKYLTTDAQSIEDMVVALQGAVESLTRMGKYGIVYETGAEDDHALLVTTDQEVAIVFGFEEETEDEEY